MVSDTATRVADSDRIRQWLLAFGEETRTRVLCAQETMPERVIGPLQSTVDLLVSPASRIPELFDFLRRVVRKTPAGTELLWLLETGTESTGPGPDDLRALFSAWVRVVSVDLSEPRGRVIVSTRVRRHAVSFVLDSTHPRIPEEDLIRSLGALQPSSVAVAHASGGFVVLTRDSLRALRRSTRRNLLSAIDEGWLTPVARVASEGGTFAQLSKQIHKLRRQLPGGGDALQCASWVGEDPVNEPTAVVDLMCANGIRYLFELDGQPVGGNTFTRLGRPYLRNGSYHSMRFDRRMPRATGGDGPIAIVGSRQPQGFRTLEDWVLFWEARTLANPERYVPRADFKRREKLMSALSGSSAHGQFYHDFFFYNWRVSEPGIATTLVNFGSPSDPDTVLDTIGIVERYFEAWADRGVLQSPNDFLESASREAAERSLDSVKSGLDLQRCEHDYLDLVQVVDATGSLSPVEEDLLNTLPQNCGVTLEIGGGYGRLGKALGSRSELYVNVELHQRYLHSADLARCGVIADFHRLPFGNISFDVIIANNVLEHAYEPVLALRELKRILAADGSLLAIIPLDALNPDYNLPTHFWKADELSVMRACQAAGLTIHRLDVVDVNSLGMTESYPTCNGLCVKLQAGRSGH